MNKVTILSIVAALLLISNLTLVAFTFMHHRPGRPGIDDPKNKIIEKLHFDAAQVKDYEKLIQWHQKEIRAKQEQIMNLKNLLYGSLAQGTPELNRDSLITQLGQLQMDIEQIHTRHFLDIRALCKEDQQKYFADLSQEIASLFAPPMMRDKKK